MQCIEIFCIDISVAIEVSLIDAIGDMVLTAVLVGDPVGVAIGNAFEADVIRTDGCERQGRSAGEQENRSREVVLHASKRDTTTAISGVKSEADPTSSFFDA